MYKTVTWQRNLAKIYRKKVKYENVKTKGWVGEGVVRVSYIYFILLLTKGFFYYQWNLWIGGHILKLRLIS